MHTLASLIEHALLLIFNIGRRVVFHRGLMMFILHFTLPLIACQKNTILTHRAFVDKYIEKNTIFFILIAAIAIESCIMKY